MTEQQQPTRELHICAQCYTMDSLMMHCGRCKTTTYCRKACQQHHWVKHKETCVPSAVQKPEINTACEALYEEVPVFYNAEQYTEFDKSVVAMIVQGEVMTLPYRFVARSTVCIDWQVGVIHIGDRTTVPSANAIRTGRWVFAMEQDRTTEKGDWILTVFMGKMHGRIISVDALPGDVSEVFVLLAWMVDHLSPLLGREAKNMKPTYTDLDPVVLYEFKPVVLNANSDDNV